MRLKILVVEDDHALRDVLRRGLYDEDFEPVPAADGATALRPATADVAAAVLDVGLPDTDGRDVCQLSCFSAGGDDYLPKPFHLAELAARLGAVLRRTATTAVAAAGDLVLDAVHHSMTVHGARTALSPTEFRLLATLVTADGVPVGRCDLVRAGRPEGAQVGDNTLGQYLSRLRRRLREAGSSLTVGTARGIGHRLS